MYSDPACLTLLDEKKTLYIWQDFCSTKVTVTFIGQCLSICQSSLDTPAELALIQ